MINTIHGEGERENGADKLEIVKVNGLPNVVNNKNLGNFIMVCPQFKEDTLS